MNNYSREYFQEITDEYIRDIDIFIYDLNVDYSSIVDELYSKFENKQEIFKVNSVKDIPFNLRKFYEEYGFFIFKNKIYSVSEVSNKTLESIKECMQDRLQDFIQRESHNLESFDLDIDEVFKEFQVSKEKISLMELEELKELNINMYKNLLKSKLILNICSEPMKLKSRKKVKGIYEVSSEIFSFVPIYGKSGEAFTSKFFEAKKEKGIIKIKADIKDIEGKMYFEYAFSFSEIVKNPIKDTDLYASAWMDNPRNKKKRTFYCKKDVRYVPLKIRKIFTEDRAKYDNLEGLDFMFEFEDFILTSSIENYLGYSIKDINELLRTPGTEEQIFLQNWSQASRKKPFGGSGLTFHDKYYISEHVMKTNSKLGEFKEYEQCDINDKKAFKAGIMKRAKTSTAENGVNFNKIMLRKPNVDTVNLYVFKNSEEEYPVDIVESVKSFMQSPVETVKVNANDDIVRKVEKYNLLKAKSKTEKGLTDKQQQELENTILGINLTLENQRKSIEKELKKANEESIVRQIDDNTYEIDIVDGNGDEKPLLFKLHIIDDEDALDTTDSLETPEERLELILDAIGGEFEENSIALIELENLDSPKDAKSIIRKALNLAGVTNQFINPLDEVSLQSNYNTENKVIIDYDFEKDEFEYEECNLLQDSLLNSYSNKVRKAILDMMSDFGFTDSTFAYNEYTCYSFGVIDYLSYSKSMSKFESDELDEEGVDEASLNTVIEKEGVYIPVVVKMTDETILAKMLFENRENEFSEWVHISKLPQLLNLFKTKSGSADVIEKLSLNRKIKLSDAFEKVANFIDKEEEENKILILSHKNCGKTEYVKYKNIFKDMKDMTVVFTENEDTHYSLINPKESIEDFVAFTLPNSFFYKTNENIYKSVGLKPFGIQMTQYGYSRVIPTNSFKCRKIFKVEVLQNNTRFDNEILSYLICNTSKSLTTNRSLSSDILTEHIYSSISKHLK